MSEVSSEAVEAARRYGGSGGWDQATDEADALLRRAFIEGAQWFAAHQPARVVPSAEEVLDEQTINERDAAEEMADRLAAALAPADVLGEHSSTNDPWQNALDYAASQPTVAEVREQVAREVADQREAFLSSPGLDPAWIAGWHSAVDHVAARIARGETKGGE